MLLLARVILYITASVTVSSDPQTSLLLTIILVGIIVITKEFTGVRVYKKSFVNVVEIGLYVNLLMLSALSWYRFKTDIMKQTAVAYTSTIITFLQLVGVIIYHAYFLVRKDQPPKKQTSIPMSRLSQATNTVGKLGSDDRKKMALLAATMFA